MFFIEAFHTNERTMLRLERGALAKKLCIIKVSLTALRFTQSIFQKISETAA